MKRVLIAVDPAGYPEELRALLSGAKTLDSSCSPDARVLLIERDGGYFLKCAPAGTLALEAQMTAYFHTLGLSCEVLSYLPDRDGKDWLLTRRISGEDCTHANYLAEPRRLAILLGERLRALHALAHTDCPVQDRMTSYFALAKENYRKGAHDASFFTADYGEMDTDAIYGIVQKNRAYLCNDTLLHGDYCLPNLLLEDWRFSGFIDLGNGGVGDRHVDLYWGAWTLRFNLGTDAYRDTFFDAYGRDRIEADALRTVAAAEVFG